MSERFSHPDERFLRRAIRLAMNGRGGVEPNPMVGCVIVKNGRVIGEAYHAKFGGPHAEPAALTSCSESLHDATTYVTLEPCCHANKKTPPCVPRLIEAKIARVVVGCLDPNPQVNGNAGAMLRGAGIQVDGPMQERDLTADHAGSFGPGSPRGENDPGPKDPAWPRSCESSCKQLIAPFIARTLHRRPYVTLKWAQSADGQVAGRMHSAPVRITNASSDRVVHELRSRCDAIAVGTNTVLNDDPLLTARGVEHHRPLLRVILSNGLKISPTSRLVTTAREHPVVLYSSEASVATHQNLVDAIQSAGVKVVALPTRGEQRFSFADVLADLHALGVTHLLVEPGPTLARFMLARGQADRIWIFRSTISIGPSDTSKAPVVDYPTTGSIELDGDVLTEYLNPRSELFFSLDQSPDFALTPAKPRH